MSHIMKKTKIWRNGKCTGLAAVALLLLIHATHAAVPAPPPPAHIPVYKLLTSTPADTAGTCPYINTADTAAVNPYKFNAAETVVPAVLIGVGIIGLESDWLKHQNNEVRDELQEKSVGKITVDDITQFVPLVSTYALNLCGVKGRHGYADLTILTATSCALMGITVIGLKNITRVKRPDGSTANSFPSGHTATAFMGAEILRREYWDVSPWIGMAGYAVAAGTGFFRMYNNRHWLTDVIARAGFGILAAQAAYWLYPAITKALFRKRREKNICLAPYMSAESRGLCLNITF